MKSSSSYEITATEIEPNKQSENEPGSQNIDKDRTFTPSQGILKELVSTPSSRGINIIMIRCGSHISAEEKVGLIKKIEELGGQYSSQDHIYDENADGVIIACNKLGRSEKVMCSIAAGKFIVKESYLDESIKAGLFLKVDDFFFIEADCETDEEKLLARAAFASYRCSRTLKSQNPFDELKIYICLAPTNENEIKKAVFSRLIEAGGGIVQNDPRGSNVILGEEKHAENIKKLGSMCNSSPRTGLFLHNILIKKFAE